MRKTIALLTVLLLASVTVFASHTEMEPTPESGYYLSSLPYRHTSAKFESMGGAGLAASVPQDALYLNPASLACEKWVWNIPQVSVTMYNVRDLVATGIMSDKDIRDNMGRYATDLLRIYGKGGYGSIARIDGGAGLKIGMFSLASDTQIRLDTHTPAGDSSSVSLVPSADTVLSIGLGMRLFGDSPVSIDLGGAVRADFRLYYEKLELKKFLTGGEVKPEEILMNSTPVVAAAAFPVDLGININLPCGFRASGVARNINGNFSMMKYYDSLKESMSDNPEGTDAGFIIETPMSLDMGIAWAPDSGNFKYFLKPIVAVDVVDTVSLLKDYSTENLLRHLRLGAELRVLSLFELRGGLNGGYITMGAGINLLSVIHLEVSYYRASFGPAASENNTDALTVRMNFLWEH